MRVVDIGDSHLCAAHARNKMLTGQIRYCLTTMFTFAYIYESAENYAITLES